MSVASTTRSVYCILSARALPYAMHCVRTLFENCVEDVSLTLLTDGPEDVAQVDEALKGDPSTAERDWRIFSEADCAARAKEVFADYPNLRAFRRGHPCWRKCTDPFLFAPSNDDGEMIILDPDLYFPNEFAFEPTPDRGLYLMRQGPNCLYPAPAVEAAFERGARMADHTDIGVAQLRADGIDLQWLDRFLGDYPFADYKDYMHIESIVWAALAMAFGGGYFDPAAWRCWERGHIKRVAIAAGVSGNLLLKLEPLDRIKCIHVSGVSKWWVVDAIKAGALKNEGARFVEPTPIAPFVEYTREKFARRQRLRGAARKLGYYRLTKSE